jgi:hypothetical protein
MKFISAVLVLALSFGADAFISPRLANVARAKALRSAVAEAPAASGMTNAEAQAIQDAAVAKAIEGAAISHKANMEELAAGGGGAEGVVIADGMTNAEAQAIQDAAVAKAIEGATLSHKANMAEMAGGGKSVAAPLGPTGVEMGPSISSMTEQEVKKATGFKAGYKM